MRRVIWKGWHQPLIGVRLHEARLSVSLKSGKYPTFLGMHGPTQQVNPNDGSFLDYLLMLWPAALCQLIAVETNRHALQRGVSGWCDVTGAEVWTFLGSDSK